MFPNKTNRKVPLKRGILVKGQMKQLKVLPILYSLSSTGKVKEWSVSIYEEDLTDDGKVYYLCSSHGYKNQTITDDFSSVIKGKNIGRSNETTPLEQAESEALSKWNGKKDKNYTETIPTSITEFTNLRPMLAQKYSERKHYITFPCYAQPKLDGVRALASKVGDTTEFTSRGDKKYTSVKHLIKAVNDSVYKDFPLDGEIFSPNMSLQQINSAVKKERPETLNLEYWVFDIANTTLSFEDRLRLLYNRFEGEKMLQGSPIKMVPTVKVYSEEQLMALHVLYSETYEGTIIRNSAGMYVFDYRSNDLLKHKDFLDDEFVIVGGKSGSGSDEDTVVFQCITEDVKPFDVRPRGTREQRREWMKDLPNLIGKKLTVRYQQLSDSGIPTFPVGITIREDL